MIYPSTIESKLGVDEIRTLLKRHCISVLGKEMVDKMALSTNAAQINEWLKQTREFRRLQEEDEEFPIQYIYDLRQELARLRIEGTHMEAQELFDLRRTLDTICSIVGYLNRNKEEDSSENAEKTSPYPTLRKLTEDVVTFPDMVKRIDTIIDKFGKIKDNASSQLMAIRSELRKTEGTISKTLNGILQKAQSEGLVDKDVTPSIRDGRLVIPVTQGLKRKIKGIVHDESASGKTVFIEPAAVVEANNRIRELENDERREIIKILTEFAKELRPHINDLLNSYLFLAKIDFIKAKAEFATHINACEPNVGKRPKIDWIQAVHPLLQLNLAKQGKKVVPLDISLTEDKRILIISGPNAGGKSVCLKTVGLLQYMLQCGLSIPLKENSVTGIFNDILIDIGDEQSIEDDLSTYSSHLTNMKNMMKHANDATLILIDEFGTGTEPQIGGAIAEAVLKQFCMKKAYGVITTHYQNLKHFADKHQGVANGAMLYDRHQMKALFKLSIGQPGSSFAIEIARKIGLPEAVIKDAGDIVGSEYIQSDKYLQDIVRDKRYWENKRRNIHDKEKQMEEVISKYENEINELAKNRKDVIKRAKEQAEELLKESNKRIENVIKEIKEAQAEKEETKRIREEFMSFKDEIKDIDSTANDEMIERKIKQIQARKERKEKRKQERKAKNTANTPSAADKGLNDKGDKDKKTIGAGDTVRIKGLESTGKVESTDGKMATVIFGDMRTKMRVDRLEHATPNKKTATNDNIRVISRSTREAIEERKLSFRQDIDIRGMRGDEAINAVMYFIDDAILVGMNRVRILHGTGNGILRQLVRQYLATVPTVRHFQDEHIQFGGAGITVVDL